MEKENDIDSLARMVANGFSSAAKQLNDFQEEVNGRFDVVEKEIRITNQRIDRVVMPELDSHSRRIKNLELKAT